MADWREFGLGTICEDVAKLHNIVLTRVNFDAAADVLVTNGLCDFTATEREKLSSTGLMGKGNEISLIYAGVFYSYQRSGRGALREVLLAEDLQRRIVVQRGVPRRPEFLITIIDKRERDALKQLLKTSAHPNETYCDMEVTRQISNLTGVEAYVNYLLSQPPATLK